MSDSAKPGTWTYDNLNRMNGSPMASYTHDAVGNRLTKTFSGGWENYEWDAVNRMTGHFKFTGGIDPTITLYQYRADGMRVRKQVGGTVTRSYYDGQMPIEDDLHAQGNSGLVVTQNFVGARGIEMMEEKVGTNVPTKAYPLKSEGWE